MRYETVKENRLRGYSGSCNSVKTDCPNPGDFELVQKNLKAIIRAQDDFRKKKQEENNPQGYKWRLN